jgi:transglutaminase-like putative cysteine protease
MRRPPPLLALLVLFAATIAAGEEPRDHGWVPRERALAAAAAATTATCPDANEVLLDAEVLVRAEADGTYVQWHEEWVKILTEQGRRARTTLSSSFTIPYQTAADCRVPLVEIVRPDGTTVAIDVAAHSQVMTDPDGMGANIFNPNDKVIRINVPDLAVGDVLHFVMYDRIVKPRMPGTFSDLTVFEDERPIVRLAVEYDLPGEVPLRSVALLAPVGGTVTPEERAADGRRVYRWLAREVPRFFPEPDMPPAHTVCQRLLVSTIPDWQTVSRWYWELSEPHLAADAAITAQVAELTAGAPDDAARIRAIFTFVAQQIRYLGLTLEAEAPGYEPHDAADTFSRRHGVCRDKAALLVAMLRAAGFTAYPTLIHSGPKKDAAVPMPWFNHAIVAVRQPDGGDLLMDPTDETATDLLPAYLGDRSYLVATPTGDPLRTSPTPPAATNLVTITTTAALDATGALRAESVLTFAGINDNAYRGHFTRIRPERRRELFAQAVDAAATGARLERCEIVPADLADTATPLTVTLTFTAAGVPVTGDGRGDLALLRLPLLGTGVGMVNFILDRTGLVERRFPLVTGVACGVREDLTMTVDPALGRISRAPGFVACQEPGVEHAVTAGIEEDRLRVAGHFLLTQVEYPPADYQGLRRALAAVEQNLRRAPVLDRVVAPPPAADLAVEEDVLTVDLADAHTWTETRHVRQRIRTYAGKKRTSEILLAYTEGWETAEVLSGTVTAPDGTIRKIAPSEINLMDQGWTGAAKRYPAGRILVANLPAVTEGSLIDYTWRRSKRDRPAFALRQSFGGFDPVTEQRLEVRLPPGGLPGLRTLVHQGTAGITHRRDEADGRTTLVWTVRDLPATRQERQLPPDWAWRPTVLLATGTWEEFAAARRAPLERSAAADTAVRARLPAILGAADTPADRIRAIRDFVATDIRAAGPGIDDLPLTAISPADTVLADGYGGSADRAVLLLALLRAAGFTADPVLSGNTPLPAALRERTALLPLPVFDTVLVRVRDPAGGRDFLLGDGDQYDDLTVCHHEGRPGLDLATGRFLPMVAPPDSGLREEYRIELDADGGARVAVVRNHHGTLAGGRRKLYAELTPELRDRHHQELVGEIAQAAVADGDLATRITEGRCEESFAVRIPGLAVRDGDLLYLALPASLRDLLDLATDQREGPLLVNRRLAVRRRITLVPPPGFAPVLLPQTVQGAAPFAGRLASSVTVGEREITVDYDAELEPLLLPAERCPEVISLLARLDHANTRTVMLRRQP